MDELFEKAHKYRKDSKFSDACDIFRELWESNKEYFKAIDGWAFAYCLRKSGNKIKAFEIIQQIHQKYPQNNLIKNLFAWCIYDQKIDIDEEVISDDEYSFLNSVDKIICDLTIHDKYSPYVKTVFKAIDHHLKKNITKINIITAENLINKIDPDKLSKDIMTVKLQTGKTIKIMSDLEKWYFKKTKILYLNENYEECIKFCDKALSFDNFLQKPWFSYRYALCLENSGKINQAIDILKLLSVKKHEWFVQYEIASLFYKLNDPDNSLIWCAESALNNTFYEKKWKLFLLMAKIFNLRSDTENAKDHLSFCINLRIINNWSLPDEVTELAKSLNISIEKNIIAIEKLKLVWNKILDKKRVKSKGVIATIMAHGRSGFIKTPDKKNYYFDIKNIINLRGNSCLEGKNVEFFIENGFDRKKNKESLQAVMINII